MRCLGIDQIYLFLEKELSPSEHKKIEDHLASCPKCKNAVEERRTLLQASESLPIWETPPDFTNQVMLQIFPEKISLRSWLTATAAGFSSIILTLFALFLLSGNNLPDLLTEFSHALLDIVRNFSILSVKLFKVVSLLIRIIYRFGRLIVEGFAHLTTIISPEVQIILITFTLILSASLVLGVRKKLMTGEKA